MMAPIWMTVVFLAATPHNPQAPLQLVTQALEAGVQPGLRYRVLEVRSTAPRGCSVTQATSNTPVRVSGRVALSLSGVDRQGRSCGGLAWTRVAVEALSWVTRDAADAGDAAAPRVEQRWVEIGLGADPWRGALDGMEFAIPVLGNTLVETRHVRLVLPKAGTPVTVAVKHGTVMVTHRGWMVRCGARRACAQVGNGRQVSGNFSDGTLWVEEP